LFLGTVVSFFFKVMGGDHSSYFQLPLLFVALAASSGDWVEDIEGGKGLRAAAYIRVSSGKQAKEGFSLDAQKDEVRKLAKKEGISRLYGFVDAGKSGIDFDQRKLDKILVLAERHEIDRLLVVEIDRIGRNSRRLLNFLWDLRDHGVIINTPNGEIDVGHLGGWLIGAIKAFASQDDNERRARAVAAGKRESFKQRRWNKPIPPGYQRAGNWIEKAPNWEPLITDAYNLFPNKRNLQSVRTEINAKYRQLLPKLLTRDQIRRILSDTVYIGKPQYFGESVLDASLLFIAEENFVRIQELLKRVADRHKPKENSPLNQLVERYGISALDYLDQLEFHHKQDDGVIVRNGTRIDGGIHRQIFQCKKCRRHFIVPTNSQLNKICPASGLCTTRQKDNAVVPGSSIHPLSYHSYSSPKTPRQALKLLKREGLGYKGRDSVKINVTQTTLSDWSQSHDES
jgi:DNA invertase Pin-like site-specific DNA recombinase